jgi:hypothetical protein
MVRKTAIEDDISHESRDAVSDLSNVVDILLNDSYKRRKTILDNRQVTKLTIIDVLSQLYDIEFLKEFVSYYSQWRTSGDKGKGRQDIVDITKFSIEREDQKMKEVIDSLGRR